MNEEKPYVKVGSMRARSCSKCGQAWIEITNQEGVVILSMCSSMFYRDGSEILVLGAK